MTCAPPSPFQQHYWKHLYKLMTVLLSLYIKTKNKHVERRNCARILEQYLVVRHYTSPWSYGILPPHPKKKTQVSYQKNFTKVRAASSPRYTFLKYKSSPETFSGLPATRYFLLLTRLKKDFEIPSQNGWIPETCQNSKGFVCVCEERGAG